MARDLLNRSCHCVYRASKSEVELTKTAAARAGLSVSAYIRQSVLFMILLEGDDSEVLVAFRALGRDALPTVKARLRHGESLLDD